MNYIDLLSVFPQRLLEEHPLKTLRLLKTTLLASTLVEKSADDQHVLRLSSTEDPHKHRCLSLSGASLSAAYRFGHSGLATSPVFVTNRTRGTPWNLPRPLFWTPIHTLTSRIRTSYLRKSPPVGFTVMAMPWLHFCRQQRSIQIEFYCHSSNNSMKVGQW